MPSFAVFMTTEFLLLLLVVLIVTVVVIICVVRRKGMGGRPAVPAEPAADPMLSSLTPAAMERLNYELALQRDRFVRLQSVRNDLALDLPHSIPLPDGEEIPYGSSIRLKIRDPQQESEITDTCVRPPPNRTISKAEVEPLPPYALYLSSGRRQPKKADLLERTARYFGMKRAEEPIPEPPPHPALCVHVPVNINNRSRQLAAFAKNKSMDLDSVPAVQCLVPDQRLPPANIPSQAAPGTSAAAAGTSASAGTSAAAAGTSASAGTSAAAAGTSASAGPSATAAGTSAIAGTSAAAGGTSALAGTSAAAAGTSASAGTSAAAAGTSASAGTSAAAAKSASAVSHYIDTKGPETRAERMASAYYAGEYGAAKAPVRSQERAPAAVASGSNANEQRDARSGEKKGERRSV